MSSSTSLFDTDLFNNRLFFPDSRATTRPPRAVDHRVAVSGASLHLRWHPSAPATATVLLFHGNGEVVSDYDGAAAQFAQAGAELAIVDFRGYGLSTGVPTLRTLIADARPSVDALLVGDPKPVVVMGRSLGAACAAELYATPPPGVAGFILESGFSDLEGLIHRRGLAGRDITAADREDFDPIPKLQRGRHPLLVLHGAEDDLVVPAEGRAAFAAAGAPEADKRLVLIPGRGHNDVSQSPVYWAALKGFITSLNRPSSAPVEGAPR